MYPFLQYFLVQVTGFEPTRLSTLEPETSASAVPPHLHIMLSPFFYTVGTAEAMPTIQL